MGVANEVFVLVRVCGNPVQVFCSDELAADDWPIARDVADFAEADLPDDSGSYTIGDADILADAGLPDFESEARAEDSTTILERIATTTPGVMCAGVHQIRRQTCEMPRIPGPRRVQRWIWCSFAQARQSAKKSWSRPADASAPMPQTTSTR